MTMITVVMNQNGDIVTEFISVKAYVGGKNLELDFSC